MNILETFQAVRLTQKGLYLHLSVNNSPLTSRISGSAAWGSKSRLTYPLTMKDVYDSSIYLEVSYLWKNKENVAAATTSFTTTWEISMSKKVLSRRSFVAGSGVCLVVLRSGSAFAANDRLVLTGSSTVAPLAAEIGKRFEETHKGIRVDVQTGGSSRGVRDARTGLADIGMASRSLYENEKDLNAYTIAFDGITMILNKDNPVQSLTSQQIVDIYTGKIRDWSAVGPGKGTIVVENKAEGRSTLDLFIEHFKLKATDVRADVIVGDNQEAIKVIAGNKMAIGYVSIGAALFEAEIGTPIKPLALEGVAPTLEAVINRTFPIIRELNLLVKGQPQGIAKEFITFAQSEAVDDLVKDLSYVPLDHKPGFKSPQH
jgi:phosphate transport system substrate-binding protein